MLEKYRKNILCQILTRFLVILIPALSILGYFAFNSIIDVYIQSMGENTRNAAHYAKAEIQSNPNYEWLLKFWTDNSGIMDIVYDDQQALNDKEVRFAELNPGLSSSYLHPEDLQNLSNESKLLYAEICFMDYTLLFDNLKEEYGLKYFYLSAMISRGHQLYMLTGKLPEEHRGTDSTSIYTLGFENDPHMVDLHPVQYQTFLTREEQKDLEQRYDSEGKKVSKYNVYVPLDTHASEVYIISTNLDAVDTRAMLANSLSHIQIKAIVLVLLCMLIIVAAFNRLTIRPIQKLQKAIQGFTEDKDVDSMKASIKPVISENEIGRLATDVSDLSVELVRYTLEATQLAAQSERLRAELDLATKIQENALPNLEPDYNSYSEFDLAASMDPAKEVGGDFFDFFFIDREHTQLALVVADVSGKGVPAAMFMMTAMSKLRADIKLYGEPAKGLEKVNNELCRNNDEGMFLSAWVAIIDIKTGHMVHANAGHEYPAICRNGGEFELIKDKHDLVLAAMEDMPYHNYELDLKPGDFIFCYTDGVPEATTKENEQFGMDRMVEALNIDKTASSDQMLKNVRKAVDDFVGDADQFDDLTMLGIRYNG